MSTKINGWTVHGIRLAKTDSLYSVILYYTMHTEELSQEILQKKSGHYAPILIDHQAKVIDFCRW